MRLDQHKQLARVLAEAEHICSSLDGRKKVDASSLKQLRDTFGREIVDLAISGAPVRKVSLTFVEGR